MDLHHLTAPNTPLAIIGLGYVGLPLAVEFGKHRPVVGFDIKPERIAELQAGHDSTRETTPAELAAAVHLTVTSDHEALRPCRIFIVTVPTPVDDYKRPDLTPLLKASATVGAVLKPGDLVIYESTVYPGCTEEDCAPVLERMSGLRYRDDFHLGYSPERINPGDPHHRLTTIKKVTSGSTPEVAAIVDGLYRQIITAGTHRASSMTGFAQRFREEGMQQGMQRGEARVLTALLKLRFGQVPAHISQRIDTADADTLLRWSERVLNALTIDDVLSEGSATR